MGLLGCSEEFWRGSQWLWGALEVLSGLWGSQEGSQWLCGGSWGALRDVWRSLGAVWGHSDQSWGWEGLEEIAGEFEGLPEVSPGSDAAEIKHSLSHCQHPEQHGFYLILKKVIILGGYRKTLLCKC